MTRREWDELLEKSPQDALPPDESTLMELVRLMREPKRKGLPLSAIVLAGNHQKSIKRCLESVLWANEIVLVHSGSGSSSHSSSRSSDDETLRIVQDPEAPWNRKLRLVEGKGVAESKEAETAEIAKLKGEAIKNASHDWVFVLMGDEACSPELAQSLQKILSHEGGPDQNSYRIRKANSSLSDEKYVERFFEKSKAKEASADFEETEAVKINEPIE